MHSTPLNIVYALYAAWWRRQGLFLFFLLCWSSNYRAGDGKVQPRGQHVLKPSHQYTFPFLLRSHIPLQVANFARFRCEPKPFPRNEAAQFFALPHIESVEHSICGFRFAIFEDVQPTRQYMRVPQNIYGKTQVWPFCRRDCYATPTSRRLPPPMFYDALAVVLIGCAARGLPSHAFEVRICILTLSRLQ